MWNYLFKKLEIISPHCLSSVTRFAFNSIEGRLLANGLGKTYCCTSSTNNFKYILYTSFKFKFFVFVRIMNFHRCQNMLSQACNLCPYFFWPYIFFSSTLFSSQKTKTNWVKRNSKSRYSLKWVGLKNFQDWHPN